VLGFLSVSTFKELTGGEDEVEFQSRAGFSECLDNSERIDKVAKARFQSRAGFSECLDPV